MARPHDYIARIEWTGNRGTGTSAYRAYDRTWDIATPGKPVVHRSNDPLLGGDADAADAIHHRIGAVCFIARSVAFPVDYAATYAEAGR